MSLIEELKTRSSGSCELCLSENDLNIHTVSPYEDNDPYHTILICKVCIDQIVNPESIDTNHWRCLNESIWSEVDAVKVISFRMLTSLKEEGWTNELLDMMYLDDDVLKWAKSGMNEGDENAPIIHKDSNGAILSAGDTVVLIKDLNVKGANFTAKRGTAVRNISLVFDNAEQIEGRVNGQHIVILTQFVMKSG